MSPRPGRITDVIESPLPRERPLDIRDSRNSSRSPIACATGCARGMAMTVLSPGGLAGRRHGVRRRHEAIGPARADRGRGDLRAVVRRLRADERAMDARSGGAGGGGAELRRTGADHEPGPPAPAGAASGGGGAVEPPWWRRRPGARHRQHRQPVEPQPGLSRWVTLSATLLGFVSALWLGILLAVGIVHNRAMDQR
jgi:hypothetical protein